METIIHELLVRLYWDCVFRSFSTVLAKRVMNVINILVTYLIGLLGEGEMMKIKLQAHHGPSRNGSYF